MSIKSEPKLMPAAVVSASVPENRGFISMIEKVPFEPSIP
jgi:hypothetical protein